MKSIVVVIVGLIANSFAEQTVVLGGSVTLNFGEKLLVLKEDSDSVKTKEIEALFDKYVVCVRAQDVAGFKELLVSEDAYLQSLATDEAMAKWREIASRAKSFKVLGFFVKSNTLDPTDLIYLTERDGTGRSVASLSVEHEDGILKIRSIRTTADSPMFKLRDWWAKNYPAMPSIITTKGPNYPSRQMVGEREGNYGWIGIGLTLGLLVCVTIVIRKLRRR